VRDVKKSKRLIFGIFSKISTGETRFSPRREHLSIFKKRKKRGGDESKDFSLRG